MTIRALIDKVKTEKPNTFTEEHLISFINEIEYDVAEELRIIGFEGYTTDDYDVELFAPSPWDRLYVSYVKAMVDYANEEYASYQLNQEQHIQDFRDYASWVVRTGQAMGYVPQRFRNIL